MHFSAYINARQRRSDLRPRTAAVRHLIFVLFGMAHTAAGATMAPWRLEQALGLPDWASLSGTHRVRYETLDGQFRSGRDGGDQILVLRTILHGQTHLARLSLGAEMLDARAMLDDAGTPIAATMVNPVELLQGYAKWRTEGLFAAGSASELRAGRLTIDVGSRRFVSRSLYRNTINTFTGVEWRWTGASGRQFQTFYTLPVNRKPNTAAALRDNDVEFDEEDAEVRFWGVYYAFPLTRWDSKGEVYMFGLDEDDTAGRPTSNRELYTPGFRVYRPACTGRFDYLLESVFQFGESRASTAVTNTTDLDHFAHFQHVELGYSFAAPWSPQLLVQYDYASGDDDPSDGDNGRFDTLFGSRRFDFGPTGIYGPFARANLSTPGVRLKLAPAPAVDTFVAYRAYWLASDRDAWTTTGVQDATGHSGSFVGHQIEARFRWQVVPQNCDFEAGVAHLFDGGFMRDAPNATGAGDATYFYTQLLFSF